jgi:iron(III) transport system substrate-binding protein
MTTEESTGSEADTLAAVDEMVAAAQAESGALVIYSSQADAVNAALGEAFEDLYGIPVSFTRLSTGDLIARYSAEADAGAIQADAVIASGTPTFVEDGVANGWFQPIREAGLPSIDSGTFPDRFIDGSAAVVQILPWVPAWNTDVLGDIAPPDSWADVVDARFADTTYLIPDPQAASAYLDFYYLMLQNEGEEWFDTLTSREITWYESGIPAVEGLAAGEGGINLPIVGSTIEGSKEQGAPVDWVNPPKTTGVQGYVALTAVEQSHTPAKARLFAQFVTSPESIPAFGYAAGSYSVLDVESVPAGYTPASEIDGESHADELFALLGLT